MLIHSANCKDQQCRNRLDSWLISTDHCSWLGVQCNDLNAITQLTLNSKLSQQFTLFELDQAEEVSLRSNNLCGVFTIAGQSYLSMNSLRLDGNQLTGLKGMQNLSSLKDLYLYRNNFSDITGTQFPTNLNRLYLSQNEFEGDFVFDEESFPLKITFLNFDGNRLTSIQGASLLENLKIFSLSNNKFQGEFTFTEDNIPPNVISLDLGGNGVTNISNAQLRNNLIGLSLNDNILSGNFVISKERFGRDLERLDLSGNSGLTNILLEDDAVPRLSSLNVDRIDGIAVNQEVCDRNIDELIPLTLCSSV